MEKKKPAKREPKELRLVLNLAQPGDRALYSFILDRAVTEHRNLYEQVRYTLERGVEAIKNG